MTPSPRQEPRQPTVTLTRTQIDMIMYAMGWDTDDADVFWDQALIHQRWCDASLIY